ncbi:MAG: dihydropyrimidinase [Thermoleophilia bacterium]
MGLLIKSGTIVTAVEEYRADVLIEGGKIVAIGDNLESRATQVVDARGRYLLPGGVDQHTHFALPFGGTRTRGFETTTAAVVGGTTTIVDFAPQTPGLGIIDSVLKHEEEQAKGRSAVDYSFHGIVMDVSERLFDEMPRLPDQGIPTVKLFMAYKGTPFMVDDGTLFRYLRDARAHGITVMVHAENGDVIDVLQKACVRAGEVEPRFHAVSRPPLVEAEATARAMFLAAMAEAPIFVVHVSCRQAAEAIRTAYAAGQRAYGETCPHYLTLTVDNLAKPDFEGAKYVCSPALRTADHLEALWQAVGRGWLQVVGSDHCGFDWRSQKDMGREDFTKIPNGAPGVQHRMAVLWTHGVETGKISRQKFVDLCCTAPARFNGLFPRKGHIGVGADADMVVWDPGYRGRMTASDSLEGVDFTPYEGMQQKGRAQKVFLRGTLTVDDGAFVGSLGQGRWVKGEPYGAAYKGL